MTGESRVFSPVISPSPAIDASNPACSVVMTWFNNTRYLRAAVDSVLAQTMADFELIVVDDGSADPAPAAALVALDPRIRVLHLEANAGTAAAANRGIAEARAPIIARLDSDDIAEPEWLARTIAALAADPELGLVGSAVTFIDADGRTLGVQPMPESDFAIRFTLLFHSPFYHSTTTYRRALFEAVGGYRVDQPVSQDHYLWPALLEHCRARNLAEPLVRYRINPNGLTATNASHDPQARTRPLRAALWNEIGLPQPEPVIEAAADRVMRSQPVADHALQRQAADAVRAALAQVEEIAPSFQRADEADKAARFAARLRARLDQSPTARGPIARVAAKLRESGLRGLTAAIARRLPRPQREQPAHPLTALFHAQSPYAGFDASRHPHDPQGWGSNHPIFRTLVAELRPKLIVEVGSWKGASAIHLAGLAREFGLDCPVVCIDTWLGSSEHILGERPAWRESLRSLHGFPQLYYTFLGNVVRAGHANRIIPLPCPSDTGAIVLRAKGLAADLIYIDAAHEEAAVYRDLADYWPLLAPGGALVGDDFANYPGVRAAALRFALEIGLAIEDHDAKFVLRKPASA